MTVRAKLREIAAQANPKQALIDSIGDIRGYSLLGQRILVATYLGREKTRGGIYLSEGSIAESRFQGKVGLVLKVGAGVPKPYIVDVGDWVEYRASDGFEHFFVDKSGAGTACRILDESMIIAKFDDPELVW
jgi:co-chaperonin GroES (HSP10)